MTAFINYRIKPTADGMAYVTATHAETGREAYALVPNRGDVPAAAAEKFARLV